MLSLSVDECGRPFNKDLGIQKEVNQAYQNLIARTDVKLLGEKLNHLRSIWLQERRIRYNEGPHVDFYPIPVIVSAAFEAGVIETIAPYVELRDILSTCLEHSESANLVTLMPLI